MAQCMAHVGDEVAYLGEHLTAAKARSGASRRDGSRPAEAQPSERTGVLDTLAEAVLAGEYDDDDAIAMSVQLVGAGSDSTTGLTGSCALHLAINPDVQDRLRSDPSRIPSFVEEVLRLEAPFRGHFRHVLRACEIGGVTLSPGDRLLLMWGAANRDPEVFADPDRVDLDRSNANRQLGFGSGDPPLHRCAAGPARSPSGGRGAAHPHPLHLPRPVRRAAALGPEPVPAPPGGAPSRRRTCLTTS